MDRPKGRAIAHRAAIDEGVEGRHQTFLEQRGDVLPNRPRPSRSRELFAGEFLQPRRNNAVETISGLFPRNDTRPSH